MEWTKQPLARDCWLHSRRCVPLVTLPVTLPLRCVGWSPFPTQTTRCLMSLTHGVSLVKSLRFLQRYRKLTWSCGHSVT